MLYCVTQENNYYLPSNLLVSQHRLRYQAVIERQSWEVPTIRQLEYDGYDNLASVYIVWCDKQGIARGTARLYPTTLPYMLRDVFSHLVEGELPISDTVLEGSRFCVDHTLPTDVRKQVQKELVVGYLEYALDHGCEAIIGVMHPVYWRNLFTKNGWPIAPLGEVHTVPDGKDALAARLNITPEIVRSIREVTGIHKRILHYPETQERRSA